ncbi:FG-GAP-like repeat-containing protein [Luteirhabdus pelagi]|uniref:FG-GAP-like repeat-containing protein n=1 Tax=Luteirhabdus pelagi TaxID=2792783 RepID=UPI00193AD797|nr:FG-GAP-like repeat-containing protein [Luteirhabdus pelagi]
MVRYLLTTVLLCLSLQCFAQLSFQENTIIDDIGKPNGPACVRAFDLNGDGFPDVLTAEKDGDRICWYQNLGDGSVGPQSIITDITDGAESVHADDLDGDGDLDIISASEYDNKIAWYENLDGLGSFGEQIIISENAQGAQAVYTADLNGDGAVDILSASEDDDKVAWYENEDGQGSFGLENIISTNADRVKDIKLADFDGDGDMDVISISRNDGKLAWYENIDGMGSFDSENIISLDFGFGTSVVVGDYDDDGDMDIVGSGRNPGLIYAFENLDGLGDFSLPIVIDDEVTSYYDVKLIDLDDDTDLDILVAQQYDGGVFWYENLDGHGTYNEGSSVEVNDYTATSVSAADMDGDGDKDILKVGWVSGEGRDEIFYHENLNGLGNFGSQEAFVNVEGVNEPLRGKLADVDGDLDLDIVILEENGGKAVWFENTDGMGTYSNPIEILTEENMPISLAVGDIDSDSDIDVAVGSFELTGGLSWIENLDGEGTFGSKNLMALNRVYPSLQIVDIDADGDNDILYTHYFEDTIGWYENLDGNGTFDEPIIIADNFSLPEDAIASDIDGDGDLDVVAASIDGDKIVWFENMDGFGSFSGENILPGIIEFPRYVNAADLDADGDKDIISGELYNNNIVWYENLNGEGSFTSHTIIGTGFNAVSLLTIYDIDDDGALDIFVHGSTDNILRWLKNDGEGNFSDQEIEISKADYISSVEFGDIDDDNDTDIMVSTLVEDKIIWLENTSNLGVASFGQELFKVYPNPTSEVITISAASPIKNLKLLNQIGQSLNAETDISSESNQNYKIDMSRFANGLYFIEVEFMDGKTAGEKIIKE